MMVDLTRLLSMILTYRKSALRKYGFAGARYNTISSQTQLSIACVLTHPGTP